GLFDLTVYEVQDSLIPNIDFFKIKNISDKIDIAFSKIRKRNIKTIFEEVNQKDRKELDTIVLTALGLNPKEFLPRIYEGICEMVRERLELPKMRKKQKATTVKFAYDEIKQSVIKDCIAHNIKMFPENFYSGDPLEFAQEKFKIIHSTGKSLYIDNFMGHYQIKDESGNVIHNTDNHLEAEYVLLYSKSKSLQILIPEKTKIIETILKNYRSWLKTLQEQIEENANHKLHNWSLAEKMTNEILDEHGLKN
ncbi:MAG: hypothetical protein M3O67_00865, partial [Bacteroidota bacterium]|nr:hypothetical protein [Bacteroidota bacterium]